MSQVTCRCGEVINVSSGAGPERIDCPRCGSRIRLRRRSSSSVPLAGVSGDSDDDGYIRFHCPCGRRLKVRADSGQEEGKCPDCDRVVPVPESSTTRQKSRPRSGPLADPDARTDELDPEEIARLDEWTLRHTGRAPGMPGGADATPAAMPAIRVGSSPPPPGAGPIPSMTTFEAGLRVCPRCGKPVHLGASNCRECGAAVPRR